MMDNEDSIKDFYKNTTIFITGGTGFLGKVLIEKILRSCESVKCIYMLVRQKKGMSSNERHQQFIQNEVSAIKKTKITYTLIHFFF